MDNRLWGLHFDQAALDAEAATDGWYALLTTSGAPKTITAAKALARYMNQPATLNASPRFAVEPVLSAMDTFRCEFINGFGAATEGGIQTVLGSA